jgi:peptide/nickel transport system ATP-binding protein
MSERASVLRADGVTASYRRGDGWQCVLDRVSFMIAPGETFGLAGESGSGKSTMLYQALGYRHPMSRVDGGRLLFQGADVLSLGPAALQRLRGDRVSLVPQNPTTALSPSMRVAEQVEEVLVAHGAIGSHRHATARVAELFALVGLPDPRRIGERYPHQLSGGQQQRVVIAMALACSPDLLLLDEPTTGLDVTTQKQILDLLRDLRRQVGMAMLYVTHDLGVLGEIADRIGVMYAGHIVEVAPIADLFRHPRHPYTRGLLAARPQIDEGGALRRPLRGMLRRQELPPGCPFAPRCDHAEPSCAVNRQQLDAVSPGHLVACQRWGAISGPAAIAGGRVLAEVACGKHEEPLLELSDVTLGYGRGGWLGAGPKITIVRDLSLTVERGELLAVVGESGSGKTTVARAISGLVEPHAGTMRFRGERLPGGIRDRSTTLRREIQYVFQNPDASLNPRMTIGGILARPLRVYYGADNATIHERVAAALEDVRLDRSYAARYPDQLSGGERQRVAIARAVIVDPVLLICDEVLSALDVSVQATIVELLRRLRGEHGLAMLFISHDLAVVRSIADRVAVLFHGELVETGPTSEIFAPPFHPYTHSLLLAVPGIAAPATPPPKSPPSPSAPAPRGQGCVYAGRCAWKMGAVCDEVAPPWRTAGQGLHIRCHIPIEDLESRSAISRLAPLASSANAGDLPPTTPEQVTFAGNGANP